jgi:hypothetical protein
MSFVAIVTLTGYITKPYNSKNNVENCNIAIRKSSILLWLV